MQWIRSAALRGDKLLARSAQLSDVPEDDDQSPYEKRPAAT